VAGQHYLRRTGLARFCQLRVQVAHHAAVDSAMVVNDVMSDDPKDIFLVLKANKLDTGPKTHPSLT
jgi:hypothetical protein